MRRILIKRSQVEGLGPRSVGPWGLYVRDFRSRVLLQLSACNLYGSMRRVWAEFSQLFGLPPAHSTRGLAFIWLTRCRIYGLRCIFRSGLRFRMHFMAAGFDKARDSALFRFSAAPCLRVFGDLGQTSEHFWRLFLGYVAFYGLRRQHLAHFQKNIQIDHFQTVQGSC